jgi:hypothetical protein
MLSHGYLTYEVPMNAKRSKRSPDLAAGESLPETSYGEMPRPLPTDGSSAGRDTTLASDFKETTQAAGRAVREQATTFAGDISHELGKKVDEQKARGIEGMRAFAGAIKTAAQELEQQSPQVARYVRDAADRVESLSGNIEGRNITELMRSASDLARSQPTMFFISAAAAGFALARFLKSSAQHDDLRKDERTDMDSDSSSLSDQDQTASPGGIDYASP